MNHLVNQTVKIYYNIFSVKNKTKPHNVSAILRFQVKIALITDNNTRNSRNAVLQYNQ